MDSLKDPLVKQIVILEHEFWESYIRRRVSYFEQNLADNALFITLFDLMSKQEFIRWLKFTHTYMSSFNLKNQRITFLCEHFISITSEVEVKASKNNRDESFSIYSTTFYQYTNGRWAIFLHQETPIGLT